MYGNVCLDNPVEAYGPDVYETPLSSTSVPLVVPMFGITSQAPVDFLFSYYFTRYPRYPKSLPFL